MSSERSLRLVALLVLMSLAACGSAPYVLVMPPDRAAWSEEGPQYQATVPEKWQFLAIETRAKVGGEEVADGVLIFDSLGEYGTVFLRWSEEFVNTAPIGAEVEILIAMTAPSGAARAALLISQVPRKGRSGKGASAWDAGESLLLVPIWHFEPRLAPVRQ